MSPFAPRTISVAVIDPLAQGRVGAPPEFEDRAGPGIR